MLTEDQFIKRFEATKLVPNRYHYSTEQILASLDNSPYLRVDPEDNWTRWAYSTMHAILYDQDDDIINECLASVFDTDKSYDFYKAAYSYSPILIRSIFKPNLYIYTTARNYHATKL